MSCTTYNVGDHLALTNTDAEILRVRRMIGDAAEMNTITLVNELRASENASMVNTRYKQVKSVSGVWLSTDPDHTGTDYYAGDDGAFNIYTGEITLHTALPGPSTNVLINYTYYKGLPDEVVDEMVSNAKEYVQWYTNEEFDWTATTEARVRIANAAMTWRAATGSLIYMYAPDIMQKGYNWSLAEFKVESKTWAGSMGIRDLLDLWNKEVGSYLAMLGKYEYFVVASSADSLESRYRSAGRSYHGYRMDDYGDVH